MSRDSWDASWNRAGRDWRAMESAARDAGIRRVTVKHEGAPPITVRWERFAADNPHDAPDVLCMLASAGRAVIGGGAAPIVTITIARGRR